jgi:thioredoxin-dependent peroxiredoxin
MKAGQIVDDFEAVDQHGSTRRLSELLSAGPVVLYFYPKAFTAGCTREACHFRDVNAELRAAGGHAVGISADAVDRQAAFAEKHTLGFPLLSDPERKLARMFGVKRPGPLFTKRATFVIDTDRRVLAVIGSELNMNVHADRAIETLRSRAATELPGTPHPLGRTAPAEAEEVADRR